MQELRLVAVSEDGSYAVLVVPGRSGRFALPIDERLRTVARGQFSRLAQYEIEVESPLRPKEIQDRIRAGETAEEIADAAGLPVDRIRRFEGPVLAEREYRAGEAQRATVRSPGESGPGRRLSEVVTDRLADIGVGTEDQEWDSRKRSDGNWQVQLAYTLAGRMRVAEWVYDPRGKHVTPDDDEAARLCLDDADWPPAQPGPTVLKATVTSISSRAAASSHPSDYRADSDRLAGGRSAAGLLHPSRTAPAAVTSTVSAQQPVAQLSQPEPAGHPSQPDHSTPRHGGDRPDTDRHGADRPDTDWQGADRQGADLEAADRDSAELRAADLGSAGPGGQDADAPAADQNSPQQPGPDRSADAPARPARRAGGGRSRRSSVPSWDEIMFGNSRQPD